MASTVLNGIDCCGIWHRPFTKGKTASAKQADPLLPRKKELIRNVRQRLKPKWGRILRISSVGDNRSIFGGMKFSIPGFFWVGKFGKYFYEWLDLSRDFLGFSK